MTPVPNSRLATQVWWRGVRVAGCKRVVEVEVGRHLMATMDWWGVLWEGHFLQFSVSQLAVKFL